MNSVYFPFIFVPLIQGHIFLKYLEPVEAIERRDVIDAYITACFEAWLDYQNFSGDKNLLPPAQQTFISIPLQPFK